MGHTEPASGLCAIVKVLLAMECGIIPGNLHYKSPNLKLHGILEGRVKVVDRNTPWVGDIVSVNSFGFGGANAHAILKWNPKQKIISLPHKVLRLVSVSGRTKEAVEVLLADIEKNQSDEEYLCLINGIYRKNIPLHFHRGYTIVGDIKPIREVTGFINNKRPIWYVYSGIGTQWASMAKDLMKFDVFHSSINRCANALLNKGIDLMDLLTNSDETSFDNVLNSFVSIVAVQIALTDLLNYLDIVPDGIVGHSVGEICCAYADGCFTLEQTILAAYWRGRSIRNSHLIPGKMAGISLSLENTKTRLPSDIILACHNCSDSVTISGPAESVSKFLQKLNQEGIITKEVKSSGVAFHSKYMSDAGPKFRESLQRIIPNPKKRSSQWISSSIPEIEWSTPMAQLCSAAYHVNNLLSPVLFYEATQHIPENAICIEIAPTAVLQSILKQTVGVDVINLSLMKLGHENNFNFFLSNIGK